MKRMLSLALAGSAFFVTAATQAQTDAAARERKNGYFEQRAADGSSVIFEDDPMSAPGLDPAAGVLSMRGRPIRTTLIRPRLHFVAELTKSVESL